MFVFKRRFLQSLKYSDVLVAEFNLNLCTAETDLSK